MPKHKHNSLQRKYLYHITQNSPPEGKFIWEPKSSGTNRCEFEPKVPRICFSTNISGCFVTLGECLKSDKNIHVLKTTCPVHYYTPTQQEVLDVETTGEVWRLKPVQLQQIAQIDSNDLCKQDINIYDYLSFNAGIKDTLSWQKTAKIAVHKVIKKFNLIQGLQ